MIGEDTSFEANPCVCGHSRNFHKRGFFKDMRECVQKVTCTVGSKTYLMNCMCLRFGMVPRTNEVELASKICPSANTKGFGDIPELGEGDVKQNKYNPAGMSKEGKWLKKGSKPSPGGKESKK